MQKYIFIIISSLFLFSCAAQYYNPMSESSAVALVDIKKITSEKTGCDEKDIKVIRDNGKFSGMAASTGTRIWVVQCNSKKYACSATKTYHNSPMETVCNEIDD